MPAYVALLRAVNVGGRSLAMADLRTLCERAGLTDVRTYIRSGNVVFKTRLGEAKVKTTLEAALREHLGAPVDVMVRSARELAATLANNPFADQPGNRVVAVFLDAPAPKRALDALVAPDGERAVLSGREIYIHFPNGQGRSKLKLPAAKAGTARNMNTVAKLASLASD